MFASVQHRALLHHDLGASLGEMAFGKRTIAGETYEVKDLLCEHVEEDLGSVVSVTRWLDEIRGVRIERRIDPKSYSRGVLALRHDPIEAAAKRYGGDPEDYAQIVYIMDSVGRSSAGHHMARALHHNTFGPFLVESIVGPAIATSDGKIVATRTVVEDLILARMGWIPPASIILSRIPMTPWMGGNEGTTELMATRKKNDIEKHQGTQK